MDILANFNLGDLADMIVANFAMEAMLVLVFASVLLGVAGVAGLRPRANPIERRLQMGTSTTAGHGVADAGEGLWQRTLKRMERGLSRNKSERLVGHRRKLILAGYFMPEAVHTFRLARIVLAVALPMAFIVLWPLVASHLSMAQVTVGVLALTGLGFLLPSLWLSHRIAQRQREIRESFPDALDMLTVCVEAGLGIDSAFSRVGSKIGRAYPVLSSLFALLALELRAGWSREDALRNFARRVELPEVTSFTTLMIQSGRLGTGIGQALRVASAEMRSTRMLRAEEKANRLPVLLAMPLVAFILPTMMTVILLPGIIGVIRQILPALGGG